jgi:hypothetical protein
MAERDFLDKMVTKRTARNPAFLKCWTRRDAGGSCCSTLAERREQQNESSSVQRASDLRFGPGPRGTMTGPGGLDFDRLDTRRVSRQGDARRRVRYPGPGQIARQPEGETFI